ncbi:hypothetical protein [Fimbriiglobus ruber]|uniref:Uncharacterized protein n=1 Tax=Fimbriiglobus ruber TaxID=1908690 RepID=A0A225CZZ3_9BACT|nr:hypothetical protein [Fimbriiglobus ruber]OWK34930.1 hypothetical protein FRUB_09772 [Fimbriiglobus ruber]
MSTICFIIVMLVLYLLWCAMSKIVKFVISNPASIGAVDGGATAIVLNILKRLM